MNWPTPGFRLSDEALDTGKAETLVAALTAHLNDGVLERFRETLQRRARAADNVEAGRTYVAAYVEFMHYSERIHQAIVSEVHVHSAHGNGPDAGKDKTGGVAMSPGVADNCLQCLVELTFTGCFRATIDDFGTGRR